MWCVNTFVVFYWLSRKFRLELVENLLFGPVGKGFTSAYLYRTPLDVSEVFLTVLKNLCTVEEFFFTVLGY